MEDQFLPELNQILPAGRILVKERMENHTSLHIGGEADYMVLPAKEEEIKDIIQLCRQKKVPYYVMGNGSNLLVADSGYRGLVIKLGENFSEIMFGEDGIVTAQAGVLLSKLAHEVARHSLTGFEFAAGIPGTLGGAVTMNAGAYDGDMKQCILSARVMDQEGNILALSNEELQLGYRTSLLQKKSLIVINATMKFSTGDYDKIIGKIKELNALRREKQPLEQYSAGSTFKRPVGYYAAKLIHDAGLRGHTLGGAQVSEKHCGFLINKENATAEEFLGLIHEVTKIVEDTAGVRLDPEVKLLGFEAADIC